MESQKSIWEALQNLRLGSEREKWDVHTDAQEKFTEEHKLCIVAQGLNLEHQNPAGIKKALQGAWVSKGCIDAKVNDDGTVNFYFAKEYQVMSVLEAAPYEYRGWMIAVDKWSQRQSPTFLQQIPFWVKIEKLPEVYRRENIIRSIGSKI